MNSKLISYIKYYDEITGEYVSYECDEPEENILDSGLCIFHDENYLKDSENKEVNEKNLKRKLSEKLAKSDSLICIEYYLPNFSFEEIYFDNSVNFSGAIFLGFTNFRKAQFKEANFHGARFAEVVDFAKAQFNKKVNFNNAQFNKKVNFNNAQFAEVVDFAKAQFTEVAIFYEAQFTELAIFYGAQFTEVVDFTEAQFTKVANFIDAQFINEADFQGAKFAEEAYFNGAKFAEEAYFNGAYVKKAVFTQAQFKEAVFYKTQFAENADFSEIESITENSYPRLDFHNVQFDIPEHIIFLKDNLSEASFVNTDITRVRFGEDVVWGDKFKIREEREIENQLKTKNIATDIQLGDVLAVYRNLRENFEFRMRYDEAGEFFVREMEMKRSYQTLSSRSKKNTLRLKWWIKEISSLEEKNIVGVGQNDWISRNISLTGLYYHLSKYGQSFFRPALFGVGIVLFSTFLWSIQPNAAGEFLVYNMNITQVVNSSNLEAAFERGLTNFLPSLSFGTELNVGLLDVAFKIVGGAITFGLIIIALRRKFERKFRH